MLFPSLCQIGFPIKTLLPWYFIVSEPPEVPVVFLGWRAAGVRPSEGTEGYGHAAIMVEKLENWFLPGRCWDIPKGSLFCRIQMMTAH